MEVTDYHNFLIEGGIISHNCGYSLVSHHFKKAIDPEDDVTGIAAIKKRLERKVSMQKKFKHYR